MRSLLKGKKGQAEGFEGIFFVLVFLFGAALFIFILYFVFNQINDPINLELSSVVPAGETSFNVTLQGEKTLASVGMFNTLFPFLLTGLIGMLIVSAMFIDTHPVFFFITLIILAVVILLGVVFSNIYQQITEDSSFNDTASEFGVMNIFLKFLPWIVAIIFIIVVIIMFSKSGQGGGGL